jgi:hypothetical protein
MTTLAAHRLPLSAAEYRYLVELLGLSMPPGWEPGVAVGVRTDDLVRRGVLLGDPAAVHPSVEMNLGILAGPRVMLDTSATVGSEGLHSLHAVAGSLGASLFALADGGVELSMFAATDLGRELVRAVPDADDGSAGSAGVAGRLPLAALHELGLAELQRDADPRAVAEVLGTLALPPDEAALAARVASAANGARVCVITARVADEVRSARVAWLHADGGWVGIRPDPDSSGRRMVRLEPVAREDLGVWVAPYVAEALANG